MMSFWLTRESNNPQAQDEEPGGIFTLGGTNSSLYQNDIEYETPPPQTGSYWLVTISRALYSCHFGRNSTLFIAELTLNNQVVPIQTGGIGAVDTGTTLIGELSPDHSLS